MAITVHNLHVATILASKGKLMRKNIKPKTICDKGFLNSHLHRKVCQREIQPLGCLEASLMHLAH